MREPERIERILDKVTTVWRNNPNLRLCQLLSDVAVATGEMIDRDPFYVEDNSLEIQLDKWISCVQMEVSKK